MTSDIHETSPRRRLESAYVFEVAWLAGGFGSKLLIQIGTLYYLTAGLGRDGVGTFYALLGLLACAVPFVQLGNYDLTVRQIARGEDPRIVAGRAMRTSFVAFLAFAPVLVILRMLFAADISWTTYTIAACGELLGMRVVGNVQAVATGFRLHYVTAISDMVLGVARLGAVFAAARWQAGVETVLLLYAFTSLPAAAALYVWLTMKIGRPRLVGGPWIADAADHRRMVTAWFAEMAAAQGDKPLLKALSDAGQTGIYGTASKLFAVVNVPTDLLTQVFRPRLGHAYAQGEAIGRQTERKMAKLFVGVGTVAGAGLFVVAWALPWVAPKLLTSEFSDVRLALMYLSIVPPLYGLQRANVVGAIARGATGAYSTAMLAGAVAGVIALALTAPAFGWRGACGAYAVYTGTSCFVTWWVGRERHAAVPACQELQAA